MAMTMYITAFIALSASTASAFVHVGPTPQRSLPQLHATESFQRSLLEARLDVAKPAASVDKAEAGEKFHRSLLEAKLAYDAVNEALDAKSVETPAPAQEEAVEIDSNEKFHRSLLEAKLAYDAIDAALAVDVDEPVSVPEPEPIAVPAAAAEAKPEPVVAATPKWATPEPIQSKRGVKPTEFTVPRELAIVPINEASVQFTAGTIGAVAGLALAGPVGAAVGASAFNYLSRKDDDIKSAASAKKVVDTASQTVLLAYNFLAQFEKDNKVVDSILGLLEKVVDKAKESESPAGEALVALESTLGGIANKVEDLNDEYDLAGGAGTVLDSVGDLVEIGLDKVAEVNDEYKFTDRAGTVVKGVVGKVTEK